MSRIHFPPEDSEETEMAPDDGEAGAEPPRAHLRSGSAVAVLVLHPVSAVTPVAPA